MLAVIIIGILNSCLKNVQNPAHIIQNETNKNAFITFSNIIFTLLLLLIFAKNSLLLFICNLFVIAIVLYIITPVSVAETIAPIIPNFPYCPKKIYISLPDANPAPIMVPIITETAFIQSNMRFKASLIIEKFTLFYPQVTHITSL